MTKIEAIVQLSRFEAVKGVCCGCDLATDVSLGFARSPPSLCRSKESSRNHTPRGVSASRRCRMNSTKPGPTVDCAGEKRNDQTRSNYQADKIRSCKGRSDGPGCTRHDNRGCPRSRHAEGPHQNLSRP